MEIDNAGRELWGKCPLCSEMVKLKKTPSGPMKTLKHNPPGGDKWCKGGSALSGQWLTPTQAAAKNLPTGAAVENLVDQLGEEAPPAPEAPAVDVPDVADQGAGAELAEVAAPVSDRPRRVGRYRRTFAEPETPAAAPAPSPTPAAAPSPALSRAKGSPGRPLIESIAEEDGRMPHGRCPVCHSFTRLRWDGFAYWTFKHPTPGKSELCKGGVAESYEHLSAREAAERALEVVTAAEAREESRQPLGVIELVPTDRIDVDPENERPDMAREEIDELAESLREFGLLEPIRIYPSGLSVWMLESGHRRLAAAQRLGWTEIRAHIVDPPHGWREKAVKRLLTNVSRRDIDPVSRAQTFRQLCEGGMSQSELGRTLGLTQGEVSNATRILDLPPEVLELISVRKLTLSHALELLRLPDCYRWDRREPYPAADTMIEFARDAAKSETTVKALRQAVSERIKLSEYAQKHWADRPILTPEEEARREAEEEGRRRRAEEENNAAQAERARRWTAIRQVFTTATANAQPSDVLRIHVFRLLADRRSSLGDDGYQEAMRAARFALFPDLLLMLQRLTAERFILAYSGKRTQDGRLFYDEALNLGAELLGIVPQLDALNPPQASEGEAQDDPDPDHEDLDDEDPDHEDLDDEALDEDPQHEEEDERCAV